MQTVDKERTPLPRRKELPHGEEKRDKSRLGFNCTERAMKGGGRSAHFRR